MDQVGIIGLDIAKNIFQAHGRMLWAASSSARRSVGRGCSLFSRPGRRASSLWKPAEERIIGGAERFFMSR